MVDIREVERFSRNGFTWKSVYVFVYVRLDIQYQL